MGQITIYVEDSALAAAKEAATRAKVSVSQWFAKFAIEEKQKQSQGWDEFFTEIDRLNVKQDGPDGWDDLLAHRYQGLGTDVPRESF